MYSLLNLGTVVNSRNLAAGRCEFGALSEEIVCGCGLLGVRARPDTHGRPDAAVLVDCKGLQQENMFCENITIFFGIEQYFKIQLVDFAL